ncbi:hypothetical protein U9M48_041297 [Paspalum notatum var. saurae]|uniref:Uncharacterized protein n=1 Tax=Paspalum notatum var. saurae TaxID=547442 RepID=A0AAQ3XF47_PASNO
MSAMNALLHKLDDADELDPEARNWRNQVRDMAYDIEDCIDDFTNNVVVDSGATNSKAAMGGFLDRAFSSLPCRRRWSLFDARVYLRMSVAAHFRPPISCRAHLEAAWQIKELRTRLQEINERHKRYKVDRCCARATASVVVDPCISAFYKEAASLVGIDGPKRELTKLVMDEEERLKVMSIVGFGGLGKTTLASQVYRQVGGQFSCKAFVSVFQKPDMARLLTSVLFQLKQHPFDACGVQDLINTLWEYLQDKSRVIITTRLGDVARTCSSDHGCIHNMNPLNEQDSRKLFFNRIFGSKDGCPPHLTQVSCKILKKCGGLPLAIVTVASILACQPTRLEEQWEYIQNSLSSNKFSRQSTLEDMMHILELSYKSLPHHLKACFLYLGAYPEDSVISKVEVLKRWVAEGFVSHSPGQDAWAVAESYFNELVNRSMIQLPYQQGHCTEDKIRRLTIDLNGVVDDTMAMNITRKVSHVRSLAVFGGTRWVHPLLEFKFLRVLILEFFLHEMIINLTGINQLYLKVEYKECLLDGDIPSQVSIVLPSQIRRLQHLETLELPWVSDCSIPSISYIIDLPRLTHLVLRQHKGGMPDGIGKVKSLRTLHGFNLPVSSIENINGLGELTNLSDLSVHCGKGHPNSTDTRMDGCSKLFPREAWQPQSALCEI